MAHSLARLLKAEIRALPDNAASGDAMERLEQVEFGYAGPTRIGNSSAIMPQRPRECTPQSSPMCDERYPPADVLRRAGHTPQDGV